MKFRITRLTVSQDHMRIVVPKLKSLSRFIFVMQDVMQDSLMDFEMRKCQQTDKVFFICSALNFTDQEENPVDAFGGSLGACERL